MTANRLPTETYVYILKLIKGKEQYHFAYDDESAAETMLTLGRFASDKSLSFSWYDAALLSQKIRQRDDAV